VDSADRRTPTAMATATAIRQGGPQRRSETRDRVVAKQKAPTVQ